MQNHKQLENTLKLTNALKGLATAYEEISVNKMQKVRGNVLSAREYLDSLSQVFNRVKISYQADIDRLVQKKHSNGAVTFSTGKNGKAISILLTSNSKLHGDIGRKVFRYFTESVLKNECDIYIIGKIGKDMFDASGIDKKNYYTPFPESQQAQDGLMPFYELLEEYETVTVFYGQFVNVLIQNPNVSHVTGAVDESAETVKEAHFYFEPSLQSVLQFFESQIFSSLFRQTLHESQLAHDASRINQMESALINIQETHDILTRQKHRLRKRTENAKQIQRMLGRRLWR